MKQKHKDRVVALLCGAIHEYDDDPEHCWPAMATVGLVTNIKGMPTAQSKAYHWLAERLGVDGNPQPGNDDIRRWLLDNHPHVFHEVVAVAGRQGELWSRVYNRAWLCKLFLDVYGETYEAYRAEMRY